MPNRRQNLLGSHQDLDEIICDLAFLTQYHKEMHPANTGDVSQVLSPEVGAVLMDRFRESASEWFSIDRLPLMASIRADGRTGYRAEGISDEEFYALISVLAGRSLLITRTGSQLPSIQHTIDVGQDGKLLNVIEVSPDARRIRIVYGNAQYGSIPSIELHIHMAANAVGILEGFSAPAAIHSHPYHLLRLARDKVVRGDFKIFNAALYTQIEGLNRNYQGLVSVVPYQPSGSASLVRTSMQKLRAHRLVLWMYHGFLARDANIRQAYMLTALAEESARAALDALAKGLTGLPRESVETFLVENRLLAAYEGLRVYFDRS